MNKLTARFLAWLAFAAAVASGTWACSNTTLLDKQGHPMHPVGTLIANCTNARGDIELGCVSSGVRTVFGAVVDNAGGITISHVTGDMDLNGHLVHTAGAAVAPNDMASLGQIGVIDAATVTTATLPTYTTTGAGVGKTITFSTNVACGTIGGYAVAVNDIVLVQSGASFVDSGPYTVTQLGDGATAPCIMVRATRADTAAEIATTQIHIVNGTRAGAVYRYGGKPSPTVDTDNMSWIRTDANRGPNEWVSWCEEFNGLNGALGASGTIVFDSQWLQTQTGGTSLIANVTSTATEDGIVTMATGASSTTVVSLGKQFITTGVSPSIMLATNQYFLMRIRMQEQLGVSDGTNTYRIQAGLGTVSNGIGSTDGIFIEHDIAQDTTHWLMNTRASSVTTAQVAGTIVTAQWERFEVAHYPGESVCHMVQNGVEQGTGITCPMGVAFEPLITIAKSLGTSSRNVYTDFFCIDRGWPQGRG